MRPGISPSSKRSWDAYTGFPVDFSWPRQVLGEEVLIYGGVHVGILKDGPPERIRDEVERILRSGGLRGGRFILREANNLAPRTPFEHVELFYRVSKSDDVSYRLSSGAKMRLPDIWGEGILFAFWGYDGPTDWRHPFVGGLLGDRIGIEFYTQCRTTKTGGKPFSGNTSALREGRSTRR